MKRRLFKLVVFLLLGAIVTLGISWFLAAGSISRSWYRFAERGYSDIGESGFWKIYRRDWFGRVRLRSQWAFEWSGSLTIDLSLPASNDLTPEWAMTIKHVLPGEINDANVIAEATGWPLLAMRSHYELGAASRNASGNYESPVRAPRGILISTGSDIERRILPVRAIWPGFAINTAFYAAILAMLWLLALGPFTARRIIRRKRGCCIKCGYDLRGAEHDACPECGAAT